MAPQTDQLSRIDELNEINQKNHNLNLDKSTDRKVVASQVLPGTSWLAKPFRLVGFILLYLIYQLANFYFWILYSLQHFRHRMFYTALNTSFGYSQVKCLMENADHLSKAMPKHICVAILEDIEISFPDLAKIAVWAHWLGVQYITFYDINGVLKSSENKLRSALENYLLECRLEKGSIKFLKPGKTASDGDQGVTWVRCVDVTDGQEDIVNAVQTLMADVINSNLPTDDITLDLFEKKIKERHHNLPDPEMVLSFGYCDSTLGLLPWQVNHSEIIQAKTHRDFYPSEFIETLERYAKIEKRFGK